MQFFLSEGDTYISHSYPSTKGIQIDEWMNESMNKLNN